MVNCGRIPEWWPSFSQFVGLSRLPVGRSSNILETQPRPQANSRYPNEKRKPGTERDNEKASPRRVLPTSFTGDVTLKLAGTTGDEAA